MPLEIERRSFLLAALAAPAAAARLSDADDAFLDDLSRRSFQYFWEQSDPRSGITRGRARFDGAPYPPERRDVGSTGDTGFSLTALCIGAERGWVRRSDARDRVRATLQSYRSLVKDEHGWFYHWINIQTGARTGATFDSAELAVPEGRAMKRPKSEVSTSDSTWLVAGALTARQYFKEDPAIVKLATDIYDRVDYQWMCNGSPALLAHGWMPEDGFLKARYEKFCQLPCMYLLGIGSNGHALLPEAWYAWDRDPYSYGAYQYLGKSLLWTYQYPLAWFDFRNRREAKGSKANYFRNSTIATRAHRAFCMDLAKEFPGYSGSMWGVTSSLSKTGYKAWGGPPRRNGIDGTVVPCAAGGSLMFAPDICLPALRAMQDRFGDRIYGRYGFADAFHPVNGFVAPDVIGLDVGITLLSAENLRSGSVWKWFMANPEAQRAMELAELQRTNEHDGE